MARKYGLAVDSILSLRVVLADGRALTTSPSEEPELFWAMCGTAGGTLDVVTEMTVKLAPVTDVYAGNLFYRLMRPARYSTAIANGQTGHRRS